MEKAHNTESGKYKIKVYAYTDSFGKQHCKTFTADTKREAERLARQWKLSNANPELTDITISDAVTEYIDSKKSALSPPTVKAYRANWRNHISGTKFGGLSVSRLTTIALQRYISGLIDDGLSAKSIRNIYGLISATLTMYRPESVFRVTLPARVRPDLHTPTDAEVSVLLSSIREDYELTVCALLCAFGPLRRSEACGLSYADIDGLKVTVRCSRVQDESGAWIYKPYPKTYSSYRTITMPEAVIRYIGKGFGYIIKGSTPQALTCRFSRAVKAAGLEHFTPHSLRHYSASIMAALGIPKNYVESRGGWKPGSHVIEDVYTDILSDKDREMQDKVVDYFSSISGTV